VNVKSHLTLLTKKAPTHITINRRFAFLVSLFSACDFSFYLWH
jgi:hypothetical protein